MKIVDQTSLTKDLSYGLSEDGRFHWIGDSKHQSMFLIPSGIRRYSHNSSVSSHPKPPAFLDLGDELIEICSPVTQVAPEDCLTNERLRNLSDFLDLHAPWSRKYLSPGFYTDEALMLLGEILGIECPMSKNIKRRMAPFFRAVCAMYPAISDADPTVVLNDGFYESDNIKISREFLKSKSLKEISRRYFGTNSKELSREITRMIELQGPNFPARITTASILRGMPPEVIVESLRKFEKQHGGAYQWRGIPREDDGITVLVPEWLMNAPHTRRLKWADNISLLIECVTISVDSDMGKVKTKTNDLHELHERILNASLKADRYSDEKMSYEQSLGEVDGISVRAMVSQKDLHEAAMRLSICIDGSTYLENLERGRSKFFVGNKNDRMVFAAEFTEVGKPVEIRGFDNERIENEGKVSEFIKKSYSHWTKIETPV